MRQEEQDLWQRYTVGIKTPHDGNPPTKTAEKEQPPKQEASLPLFKVGEKAPSKSTVALRPPADQERSPKMDSKVFGRMKRGRMTPEARLDLHGLTVADAHAALAEFVFHAESKGLRLVLVITGKGGPKTKNVFPTERGILRRQVPEWLKLPPLSPLVLDVVPANRKHGGEGALYVYLRRRR